MYTLGFGDANNSPYAKALLNTKTNTLTDVEEMWATYNGLTVGQTISLMPNTDRTLIKFSGSENLYAARHDYTNGYFSASDADGLHSAFDEIVGEIMKLSSYDPTLVNPSYGADLSGYVTFVDHVGKYMNVESVDGFVHAGHMHTGAEFSKHFLDSSDNNPFGTRLNPTAMGDEFIMSIKTRLGIGTVGQEDGRAETQFLIQSAFNVSKQLYYGGNAHGTKIIWVYPCQHTGTKRGRAGSSYHLFLNIGLRCFGVCLLSSCRYL